MPRAARPVQTRLPHGGRAAGADAAVRGGALLALALRQAQIHQSVLLGSSPSSSSADGKRASSASNGSSSSAGSGEDAVLWTHDSRGLLRLVEQEVTSRRPPLLP